MTTQQTAVPFSSRVSSFSFRALAVAGCLLLLGANAAKPVMTDPAISDAIESQYIVDEVVPFNDINVSTTNGIVTLTGKVSNLEAKDRAARIAMTVKGVRSVVNNINVKPYWHRSDGEIQADVDTALNQDPTTKAWQIQVAVNDKKVTLTGVVDSWPERKLAATVAEDVRGVKSVVNKITVNPQENRPDSAIKADVQNTLESDVRVDNGLIYVSVNDGNVTLTGVVGSAAERAEAVVDAWVAGVQSVDDSGLKVKKWAREPDLRADKYAAKSDPAIRDAIEDAMAYDPRVASFDVQPTVINGAVTLHGTVDNLKARRAAASDARNTVGVINVTNLIRVQPPKTIKESVITARVQDALKRDPVTEPYDVTVSTVNGIVNLYGTVNTYFEKMQAEDDAARVMGVKDVENHLAVNNANNLPTYNPYVDKWNPADSNWYNGVTTTTRKPDTAIEANIKKEFYWSPFVNGDDVNVSVKNGVATLTGVVHSHAERKDATQDALAGGAIKVVNKLEVM